MQHQPDSTGGSLRTSNPICQERAQAKAAHEAHDSPPTISEFRGLGFKVSSLHVECVWRASSAKPNQDIKCESSLSESIPRVPELRGDDSVTRKMRRLNLNPKPLNPDPGAVELGSDVETTKYGPFSEA